MNLLVDFGKHPATSSCISALLAFSWRVWNLLRDEQKYREVECSGGENKNVGEGQEQKKKKKKLRTKRTEVHISRSAAGAEVRPFYYLSTLGSARGV